jgi:hypothetical protein
MSRRYNFRQSQEILRVNPKTFARWLREAGIDPEEQIDKFDPRQKWLTDEQILMLAQEHGRVVDFPDQEQAEETHDTTTLTTLREQLFALEQQLTHRFDQLDARLTSLLTELQLVRLSAPPPPQERPPAPATQTQIAASASTLTSTSTHSPRPTSKTRSKRKKTKAKQALPDTWDLREGR